MPVSWPDGFAEGPATDAVSEDALAVSPNQGMVSHQVVIILLGDDGQAPRRIGAGDDLVVSDQRQAGILGGNGIARPEVLLSALELDHAHHPAGRREDVRVL